MPLKLQNSPWRVLLVAAIALGMPPSPLHGQNHFTRFHTLDIQHYRFEIDLADSTDLIRGTATLLIRFKQPADSFCLDLESPKPNGRGMTVVRVQERNNPVSFYQLNDRLVLFPSGSSNARPVRNGDIREYTIEYQGVPSDGLIISMNRYGDRTFFGDNWPDRAQHWLPVVDHPSDKATLEFLVEAPGHYRIVSNGLQIGGYHMNDRVFAHWKTIRPLPTKLMVIGVSPFSVDRFASSSGIQVSSWVFPQNRKEGFYDYRIAASQLDFFENYIAPFPYPKLANVQSKTIYGGMENAGCIFYRERSVTGRRENVPLFAHEIAHQWFGDAVTEGNWHHIWLSEGFATYLEELYLEHSRGEQAFRESLTRERDRVIRYARERLAPVVDTTLEVSVELLSPNSYQKGAWVLHMLRGELGDSLFRESLRHYYLAHRHGNALTGDFVRSVGEVTGRDMQRFFRQWLYEPGHPVVSAQWKLTNGKIHLEIEQKQQAPVPLFEFPLEMEWILADGNSCRKSVRINRRKQHFVFDLPSPPLSIILDPECKLLFESHQGRDSEPSANRANLALLRPCTGSCLDQGQPPKPVCW